MTTQTCVLSRSEIERLADIIMVMQRCFVLHLSQELSHGQVSFPQFFLLGHLSGDQSLSMKEIAERMNHRTAATTGLIDRLEKLGYVHRTQDAGDRRKVMVHITPKGRRLVGKIRDDMIGCLTDLSGLLAPSEQTTWLAIYEKIHQHITCPHS